MPRRLLAVALALVGLSLPAACAEPPEVPDPGGGLGILGARQAFAHVGLRGAGRGQHLRAGGAEHLGVDVRAGAQHRQARHAEFADVRAGRLGAAQAGDFLVHGLFSGGKRIGP